MKQTKLESEMEINFVKKNIGYDTNALYIWAIAQEMPTGKHEHIKSYDLKQLKNDILNNELFEFVQIDIETPEDLKEKFSEMCPILKVQKLNLKILVNICKITIMKMMFHLIKVIN